MCELIHMFCGRPSERSVKTLRMQLVEEEKSDGKLTKN